MLFEVMSDGDLVELVNPPDQLSDDMAIIFVSPFSKRTFIWVGPKAGMAKKFVAAREGGSKRMESGYPIIHVQNDNAEDIFQIDYKKWIEQVRGSSAASSAPARERSAVPQEVTPRKEEISVARVAGKTKSSTQSTEQSATKARAHVIDDLTTEEVLAKLNELTPVEGMVRDYVIIHNKVGIVQEVEGKQVVEFVQGLPEGAFFSPHYVPRLFIYKDHVIGMELWRTP